MGPEGKRSLYEQLLTHACRDVCNLGAFQLHVLFPPLPPFLLFEMLGKWLCTSAVTKASRGAGLVKNALPSMSST